MTGRSRPCTSDFAHGRMKKATEFFDAAVVLDDDAPNASVDLYVDAGIAAADVICCNRLGEHASGENHAEAVSLLNKAEPNVSKQLQTLLGVKSKVAYTHRSVTPDEQKKAARAAAQLLESARRLSRPPTQQR